jgi:hypothetical protein
MITRFILTGTGRVAIQKFTFFNFFFGGPPYYLSFLKKARGLPDSIPASMRAAAWACLWRTFRKKKHTGLVVFINTEHRNTNHSKLQTSSWILILVTFQCGAL